MILQAGQSRAVDRLLNFPVMDMNRNAIWRDSGKVPKVGIERMNRFWGDEFWRQAAHAEARQHSLFNLASIEQYHCLARGHFTVRRLECVYGVEVKAAELRQPVQIADMSQGASSPNVLSGDS